MPWFAPLEERSEERDEGRKGVVGREGALWRVCEVDRGAEERARGVVEDDIVVMGFGLRVERLGSLLPQFKAAEMLLLIQNRVTEVTCTRVAGMHDPQIARLGWVLYCTVSRGTVEKCPWILLLLSYFGRDDTVWSEQRQRQRTLESSSTYCTVHIQFN